MYLHIEQTEIFFLLPVLIAFVISFFTSMGGVSGAFLLLPVQLSLFHITGIAVTPTMLLFNIIAIPGGVWQYIREQRMAWPLAWVLAVGSLPGLFAGGIIRIRYLPDPAGFKVFAGCVLAYIGLRLVLTVIKNRKRGTGDGPKVRRVQSQQLSIQCISFSYDGSSFAFSPLWMLVFAMLVGSIGGIYGIGGGMIVAPFLVSIFRMPVHAIAGAVLLSAFLTSVGGLAFYLFAAGGYTTTGAAVAPYWSLGLLFGIGGIAGTWCGARVQKFVPERLIILLLAFTSLFAATRYIWQYFD
jgi:uncharacterized protein